jgi:hypothetical protein
VQPNASKLVGGLISYLNCLLPPQYVDGSGILDGALLNCGISAHWRVVTKENLQEYRPQKPSRFSECLDQKPSKDLYMKENTKLVLLESYCS